MKLRTLPVWLVVILLLGCLYPLVAGNPVSAAPLAPPDQRMLPGDRPAGPGQGPGSRLGSEQGPGQGPNVGQGPGIGPGAGQGPGQGPATGRRPPTAGEYGSPMVWGYYHIGDSPKAANGDYVLSQPETSEGWQHMPLEETYVDPGTEYSWFAGALPPPPDGMNNDPPYLGFLNASYAFEVYAGSQLIFRYGDMTQGVTPPLGNKPVYVSLRGISPQNQIILRVHSNQTSVLTGKLGPVFYGSLDELKTGLIKSEGWVGLGAVVFFIIGFLSLLLYFMNRDNRSTLYFGMFCLLICLDLLLRLEALQMFVDLSQVDVYVHDLVRGGMVYLFALYFVEILRPVYASFVLAIGKAVLAAGILMTLLTVFAPEFLAQQSSLILAVKELGFALLSGICLYVIARSVGKRMKAEAGWFLSGFTLFLIINLVGYPIRFYSETWPERNTFGVTPMHVVQVMTRWLDDSLLFSALFFAVILMKTYTDIYRLMKQNTQRLASWNQTLETNVRERTQAIQTLLDHAGQGFLTFDARLVVQGEYSIECRRLFERDIADTDYVELMVPNDAGEREFYREILGTVFQSGPLEREVCLSLLPSELSVLDKQVQLEYKWVGGAEAASGKVMVILTDISEQRQLEHQIAHERRVLNMVVWVIKHYRDFKEIVEDYRQFALQGRDELMRSALPVREKWSELSRIVHTFKGNFAQIDFVHTTEQLHQFETELLAWRDQVSDLEADDIAATAALAQWLAEFDMLGWMSPDLEVLRDVLGDRFDAGQETVTIEVERLRHLEQQVYRMLPSSDAKVIVSELRKLQFRPFRELLGMYPEYAGRLAERLGKELRPVEIRGGDMLVDPDRYLEFIRTLTHVFRNMVDHGIESPADRASMGKDRQGTITCELLADGPYLRMIVANDGKELSLPEIRQRATQQGLCTVAEFDALSTEEQRMLIFREGFSTRVGASDVSGRGIGLCAVQEALSRLNGTVRVESSAAGGTLFQFTLPYEAEVA